jgi:hypothetical protein
LRPDGIFGKNNTFAGKEKTLDQYFDRRPITGFFIAKDHTILIERNATSTPEPTPIV